MPRSKNEIAILLSFAGYTSWVIGDAFVKLAADTLSIAQIMAVNFLSLMIFVFVLASVKGGYRQLGSKRPAYQLVSSILASLAAFGATVGIIYLTLADFYTIVFTAPLIVTILARIFLKEKADWKTWAAIVFGFMGVIVAVRFSHNEGHDVSWIGLGFTLLSAITYCLAQLIVRAAPDENNYSLSFWPRLLSFIAATAFCIWHGDTTGWTTLGIVYAVLSGIISALGVLGS